MSMFEEEVIEIPSKRKSASKPLDKQFDAAKRSMVPPPKPVKLKVSVRKQGRPSGGHITIAQKRIDALDDITYEAKVARTLGIGRGTLAQWIDKEVTKYPLPFVLEDGHRLFRKDIVLRWLKDTDRWTAREEYRS